MAGTQAVTVMSGNNQHTEDLYNIKILPTKYGGTGAPYLLRRLAKTEPAKASPQTLRLAGRRDGGGFTTNFTTLGQPKTPPRNTVGVL